MSMNVSFLSVLNHSFKKSLRGEEKLWIVFWGWFVSLLFICWAMTLSFGSLIDEKILLPLPLFYYNVAYAITMFVMISFRAFLVMVVWKCAPNTNQKTWSCAARTMALFFALLSIYGITTSITHMIVINHKIAALKNHMEGNRP
jgi:hypothetical protein